MKKNIEGVMIGTFLGQPTTQPFLTRNTGLLVFRCKTLSTVFYRAVRMRPRPQEPQEEKEEEEEEEVEEEEEAAMARGGGKPGGGRVFGRPVFCWR